MKKIHINESKLKNNFNDDLEPMSDFERKMRARLAGFDEKEAYLNTINREEDSDNLFYSDDVDDDLNEVNNYILSAANEGIISFKNIKDYIESNEYIKDNKEKFQVYLDRISGIIDSIDNFLREYGK